MVSIAEYKQILNKPKKKIRQIEGCQQVRFGSFLRKATLSPNVVFYTYSGAGEKKPMTTAINQKRKGLRKGDLDYRFEIRNGKILRIVYIEFKSEKGSLTPEQKQFFSGHQGLENVECYLARSAEEALDILIKEKIYHR